MMYCNQCFNIIKGDCPHEYCERRLKETGNARKNAMIDAREKHGKPIDYVNLYAREKFSHVTYTEENKMTRQEAIKKIDRLYNGAGASHLISALEDLGLIKFDEEKKSIKTPAEIINMNMYEAGNGEFVVKKLNEAGYQIVKIGFNATVCLESCVEMPSVQVGRTFNGKLKEIKQQS